MKISLGDRTIQAFTKVKERQADPATCNSCVLKAKCTESERGRMVRRSYHTTEPYKKAMRKRSVWVEPLFGEAKAWYLPSAPSL